MTVQYLTCLLDVSVIAGHFRVVCLHWASRPGLPIWPNVKSLFVGLQFYDWLAALAINQGGLKVSTELRQNHSQRKLEWVFCFFIGVTGTGPIYIHIAYIYTYIYSLKFNLVCNWD